MGIEAPARVKFRIIQMAMETTGNMLDINLMCQIAEVSRSGYYAWVKAQPKREDREQQDREAFEKILEAYRFRGRANGAKGIHMRLLHMDVLMNLKKIRRLMKKYGLQCPLRRENPYRKMARAMKTNAVFPNAVNREFQARGRRKTMLTDITYLIYPTGRSYLSTILDAVTREVLAYQVSESLEVGFVLDTVAELVEKHGAELDNTTIVHSDQGCHYTSRAFIAKLKELGYVQSMSRKGNCWDNAPQESFFGHFKDEIREDLERCRTFEEVKSLVEEQMDYYNNDRYQWELLKLSPREYNKYLETGVYPLRVCSVRKREWV